VALPKPIATSAAFDIDRKWLTTDQEAVPQPDGFGSSDSGVQIVQKV
jgi:hypothetical protein